MGLWGRVGQFAGEISQLPERLGATLYSAILALALMGLGLYLGDLLAAIAFTGAGALLFYGAYRLPSGSEAERRTRNVGIVVAIVSTVILLMFPLGSYLGRGGEQARPLQPKTREPAFSFTEVPDHFDIYLGGVGLKDIPRNLLALQVPLSELTGVDFGEKFPLQIYFDATGALKVDALIYDDGGRLAAIILNSEFKLNNPKWDRNWDSTAFEIVDEGGRPYFQIERPAAKVIRLGGVFRFPSGRAVVTTGRGFEVLGRGGRMVPADRPNVPLFVYPGNPENLQKRRAK